MRKTTGLKRRLPIVSPNYRSKLPLTSTLSHESPSLPLLYIWDSSLPEHWEEMSPRPLKQVLGREGARSTLDFLLETQKYIVQITDRQFSLRTEPRYPVSRLRPHLPSVLTPTSPSALLGSDQPVVRVSYRVTKSKPPIQLAQHQRPRRKLL